jgi:hypothetical protein
VRAFSCLRQGAHATGGDGIVHVVAVLADCGGPSSSSAPTSRSNPLQPVAGGGFRGFWWPAPATAVEVSAALAVPAAEKR